MKTHPKSRLYVGRALEAQDELEAITRRQAMRVLEKAPPDKEPGRLVAAICIGVTLAALFVSAILEVLHVR